jgi:putative FmdB family regulatory protein
MPTYEYALVEGQKGCPDCRNGFEARQAMKDDPLKACPRCGAPVRRVIGPANITTKWGKSLLSDANLKRHGFKTLRNEGGGRFSVR